MDVAWGVLDRVISQLLRQEFGIDVFGTCRKKQYRGVKAVEVWVGLLDGTERTLTLPQSMLRKYGVTP